VEGKLRYHDENTEGTSENMIDGGRNLYI